jgi:hypothetical protein
VQLPRRVPSLHHPTPAAASVYVPVRRKPEKEKYFILFLK